ncbi:MAG: class I SAM-dependent methyltransferase [Ruminiclostridium sp.]
MSTQAVQDFYGSIAEKYHWFFSSWENIMNREMDELVPLLQKYNVNSVLDCACGTGLQSIGLAKHGFCVVGSDLSMKMLEIARENAKQANVKLELVHSDFRELQKNIDKTFDAVICMGNSIPHLLTDEDMRTALNSIYNCINSKGIAVFDIRNYDYMLSQKPKFLPMRISEEKDGKIVSILYAFDYLERTIQFNVVYLIFDKASGERKMEVDTTVYNPIGKDLFLRLLNETGFKDISVKDTITNYLFTAIRG